jgi:hypothetical protein
MNHDETFAQIARIERFARAARALVAAAEDAASAPDCPGLRNEIEMLATKAIKVAARADAETRELYAAIRAQEERGAAAASKSEPAPHGLIEAPRETPPGSGLWTEVWHRGKESAARVAALRKALGGMVITKSDVKTRRVGPELGADRVTVDTIRIEYVDKLGRAPALPASAGRAA